MNPKNTKPAGSITRSSSKDKTNQANPGGLSTETVKISGKEEVVEVVSIPSNSNAVVIHFVEKYGENFSISNAFDVLRSVRQEGLWATRVSFIYSVAKNKVYYVLNNDFKNIAEYQF